MPSPLDETRKAVSNLAKAEVKVSVLRAARDRAIHDLVASLGPEPSLAWVAEQTGLSLSAIRWILKGPRPPK